jgi:hypothetical protein
MKTVFASTLALLCSLVVIGCASNDEPAANAPAAETGDEDALTSAANKSCGAAYTPALRKYELAVQASKRLLAGDACEEITHSKDASYSATVTTEDIANLMLTSIDECAAFRDVFNDSPYAAPVRTVLAPSLLGSVASGRLSTDTFVGLGEALVGTTMYGPKPGVAHTFLVKFAADGQASFESYDFDLGDFVSTPGTYAIDESGAVPTLVLGRDGLTTSYTIRYQTADGRHDIELVPAETSAADDDAGAVISTNSDPCSA